MCYVLHDQDYDHIILIVAFCLLDKQVSISVTIAVEEHKRYSVVRLSL